MDKASLDTLARQLPLLQFDPAEDIGFAQSSLAQEYLDFYGINFCREFEGLQHGFGLVDSAVFKIAVHYWLQPQSSESMHSFESAAQGLQSEASAPKGTLFLVHGYYDHAGLYGNIIRSAIERGYSVVIFDLPGHGLSSGERASIDSFTDYSNALAKLLKQFQPLQSGNMYIAGQSTGGAVVLDYLWRSREANVAYPFTKTVLLAPLVRARGWRELGWLLPVLKAATSSFKRSFAPCSHDQEFLDFIAKDDPLQARTLPLQWILAMKAWIARVQSQTMVDEDVLLIQGDADRTVDWKYNNEILQQKIPSMRRHYIEGAAHHLIGESAEYRREVFDQLFETIA